MERLELSETKLTMVRLERENPSKHSDEQVVTLKEMLDTFTFTLGYENEHLLEVLVALMTTGKICVEFRDYNQRLQLTDPKFMMTRPETTELFNDYLASIHTNKRVAVGEFRTQKITVQRPRNQQ